MSPAVQLQRMLAQLLQRCVTHSVDQHGHIRTPVSVLYVEVVRCFCKARDEVCGLHRWFDATEFVSCCR